MNTRLELADSSRKQSYVFVTKKAGASRKVTQRHAKVGPILWTDSLSHLRAVEICQFRGNEYQNFDSTLAFLRVPLRETS
jgi:hypothetical protein